MPHGRTEVIDELQLLVAAYREIAETTSNPELTSIGLSLGRALDALEQPPTTAVIEQAGAEIASARDTLARIRSVLDH